VRIQGNKNLTPLHFACISNCSVEVIQFLAEEYPEVLGTVVANQMPLHFAASRAPLEVIQYLVNQCPVATLFLDEDERGYYFHEKLASR
jgi:ankyrin repeat protein